MRLIDYVPDGFKLFEMECGRKFVARENSCLFCNNCTDIFYDSSGIYMIMCEKYLDTEKGIGGNCEEWEGDTLK